MSHVWQHGGVSLSPRCVSAGAGVGGGEEDVRKMRVFFFELMKNITFNVFSCLLFDSETPFEPHLSCVCWLWDFIWLIVKLSLTLCFSSFFFSLYIYTYEYTYFIIYLLVPTKQVPAWIPVKASFSTSDTIVTLYRHRSTNRCVSLQQIEVIFIWINEKHYLQCLLLSFVWLWDSIWT